MRKICLLLSILLVLASISVMPVSAAYNTEIDMLRTVDINLASGEVQEILFGANFDSDVLHMSFDVKAAENNTEGATLLLKMNGDDPTESGAEANDSDQYDYTQLSTSFGRGHRTFRITDSNATVFEDVYRWYTGTNTEVTKEDIIEKGRWHKVDLYFNKIGAERGYDAYVDGAFVGTGWYQNRKSIKNFKGVRLEATGGSFEIDNLYAKKYSVSQADWKKDELSMIAEYIGDGKTEIIFSEALAAVPTAENFVVTDAADTPVSVTVESASVGGAVLNFGSSTGIHTVSASGLSGAISGLEVTESVDVIIPEDVSVSDGKYMIFKEDFQGYKYYKNLAGGDATYNADDNVVVPVGWANVQTLPLINDSSTEVRDKYTDYWNKNNLAGFAEGTNGNLWIQNSLHIKTNAGGITGNNALDITTSAYGAEVTSDGKGAEHGGYVKYFSNDVATGNFTLEFDVAATAQGGWSIGLVPYDNYNAAATYGSYGSSASNPTSNYSYNRTNYYGENKYLYQRATLSHIIGQLQSDDKLYVPSGVGKAFSADNIKQLGDATMVNTSADTFTHIKIDFNLDSGNHTVTVNDKTYVWEDVPGRFEKGVMGVTLRKYKDTTTSWGHVIFDNIEVYKSEAYFVNQDFDGYDTTTNEIPGGWYRMYDQLARIGTVANTVLTNTLVSSDTGVSGETGDNSFKLNAVNQNIQQNLFTRLFSKPAYGGHPVSIEFDLKSSANTSWQLHQVDREHMFLMKGYNETGTLEKDTLVSVTHSNDHRTSVANSAIFGYSGWEGTKTATLNWVANSTINGNSYKFSDSTGKCLDLVCGSGWNWAYTAGIDLLDQSGVNPANAITAENTWNHYKVTIIPVSETQTDYEIAIWPSSGTEEKAVYSYATAKTNSLTKPVAGIGFVALSDNTTAAEGSIWIDNIKCYESEAYVDEYGDTWYLEKDSYNNEKITGIDVEYADGSELPLENNMVISKQAKRIAINFSAPVATPQASEITQPLNKCMTSTVAGTDDSASWTEEQMQYFKVNDTVDDAVALRRVYSVAERNIEGLPEAEKYLSADRKILYVELSDEMFASDKEYVLSVSPNITFESSAYSALTEGAEIHFGISAADSSEYKKITLVKEDVKNEGVYYPVSNLSALTDMIKEGKIYIGVTGANTAATEEVFKLVAGQYSDNVLGTVTVSDLTFAPESFVENVYEITVDSNVANSDAGIDRIMCMLLDFDNIAPVAKQIEVK